MNNKVALAFVFVVVLFGFDVTVTGGMPQDKTSVNLNRFNRSTVNCGTDEAENCWACEKRGKRPSEWCNGDCGWDDGWFYDSCELKVWIFNSYADKVNCGNGKKALSCKLCQPKDDVDDGTHSWCGADCFWYEGLTGFFTGCAKF